MDSAANIVLISVLGPVIGSALGVIKRPSEGYVCNLLCFAAGVMLAVSFLELIPESIKLASVLGCVIGFSAGTLVMYAVDRILPHLHPQLKNG